MNNRIHKTEGVNRTQHMRLHPYVFTGKERDEETGFGYFGARYMDYELMTMWLSVDPMADKYPSISPYAYCAWNPVKLVDPDGCMIDDYFTKEGKYLGSDNANTNYIRIIPEATWNNLKDENGNVNHNDANFSSHSFSEESAVLSPKAQLSVYQHYNPTEYNLEETPSDGATSSNPGMITKIACENNDTKKDIAIVTHLYIRLENNRTPNKDGDVLCDNADEIVNSFIHEKDHIDRALKMGYKKWLNLNKTSAGKRNIEGSAIKTQRSHSSWNGCRESFKKGVKRYEKSF